MSSTSARGGDSVSRAATAHQSDQNSENHRTCQGSNGSAAGERSEFVGIGLKLTGSGGGKLGAPFHGHAGGGTDLRRHRIAGSAERLAASAGEPAESGFLAALLVAILCFARLCAGEARGTGGVRIDLVWK